MVAPMHVPALLVLLALPSLGILLGAKLLSASELTGGFFSPIHVDLVQSADRERRLCFLFRNPWQNLTLTLCISFLLLP